MSVSGPGTLRDERGTTLVELMVALMAGLVIISALTMVIMTTMHGTARVTARVEATQRARIALVRLMQELHSACISPEIAPVKEKSEGNALRFVHQTGTEVQPTPVLSVVSYSSGTLTQADFAYASGTAPNWIFAESASSTKTLLTKVAPVSPSSSIFSYYRYSGGTLSTTPQATPLSKTESELTVEVRAALTAEPEKASVVRDAGSGATVQDAATLRLTPPSFNEGSPAKPCA
jgi:type II secretory pathway component PulJ